MTTWLRNIISGSYQVSSRLPLQSSLIKIPLKSLAPQRLRERRPLHLHPPPSSGRSSVWRAALREMEPNSGERRWGLSLASCSELINLPRSECSDYPAECGQSPQWTQHIQVCNKTLFYYLFLVRITWLRTNVFGKSTQSVRTKRSLGKGKNILGLFICVQNWSVRSQSLTSIFH